MPVKVINHREVTTARRQGWTVIYVGRPTIFGNPYKSGRDGTRDEACDKYMRHLRHQWKVNHQVRATLTDIADRSEAGERIALQCYCSPRRCHANEIEKAVNGIIQKRRIPS